MRVMVFAAGSVLRARGTTAAGRHRGHDRLAVGVREAPRTAAACRCCRGVRPVGGFAAVQHGVVDARVVGQAAGGGQAELLEHRFGSSLYVEGASRASASRAMIHSSLRAPGGRLQGTAAAQHAAFEVGQVPSSSAHCRTGRMRSASAAVSDIKKSQTTRKSRLRSPAMTAFASGEATAMLEAWTKRQRTPSGCPSDLSSWTAGRPGPGMALRDAPDAGHVGAGGGVGDLAVAGELVGLLAVFAAALAVALAGEGAVAAAGGPGQAQQEAQVDGGRGGVGAVHVLFHAAAGEDVAAARGRRRRAGGRFRG